VVEQKQKVVVVLVFHKDYPSKAKICHYNNSWLCGWCSG